MRKEETELVDEILAELRTIPHSFWEKVQQTVIRGSSDIRGTCVGQSWMIEVKTDLDPVLDDREHLQMYKMVRNIKAGGASAVMCRANWQFQVEMIRRRAAKRRFPM